MSVRSRHTRDQDRARSSASGRSSATSYRSLVELTTSIVRSCVREPDQVKISYDQGQDRMMIEVASKDRGMLIGRGGRTLRALEDVLLLSQHYVSKSSDDAKTSGERMSLPLIELTTSRRDSSE
jgi:predicted RNA-binding protein YlqC (UPF0109 family)